MGQEKSGDGRLTTHVLDTVSGKPAANLRIELRRIENQQAEPIREIRTNDDGRCNEPLLSGETCGPVPTSFCFMSANISARLTMPYRSLTSFLCALAFQTKKRIIMYRFSFRPFPIPPIAGAKRHEPVCAPVCATHDPLSSER